MLSRIDKGAEGSLRNQNDVPFGFFGVCEMGEGCRSVFWVSAKCERIADRFFWCLRNGRGLLIGFFGVFDVQCAWKPERTTFLLLRGFFLGGMWGARW